MADATTEALLAAFDQAPLNRRYWITFGLLATGAVLDFLTFSSSAIWSRSLGRNGI
jgi:hypothetical protein